MQLNRFTVFAVVLGICTVGGVQAQHDKVKRVCPDPKCAKGIGASATVCGTDRKSCRKFENQCEFQRANCKSAIWKQTDALQCRQFKTDETKQCACPALLTCSRRDDPMCVQQNGNCKLMQNQCDKAKAKCLGEIWNRTDAMQCKGFPFAVTKPCACPKLEKCSKTKKNICMQAGRGCKLMQDECAVEHARCQGETLTKIDSIQCKGFKPSNGTNTNISTPTPVRSCACPRMLSCSTSTTKICVKGPNGCKLLQTECDLERARCLGENWTKVDAVQCRNFKIGIVKSCSCPKLASCGRRGIANVCVKGSNGCKLFANACDLERARCLGEKWQEIDMIQCRKFNVNKLKACACPRLEACARPPSAGRGICVRQPSKGCKLMRNECDLERARCLGENWLSTDSVQCNGFRLGGPTQACTCPKLDHCSSRNRTVCVKGLSGCKLLKHECDFVRAICAGEGWSKTDPLQCRKLPLGTVRACNCPCLHGCSNSTRVCGVNGDTCKNFNSECDMRRATCGGEKWTLTHSWRCDGISPNQTQKCHCPRARNCSKTQSVCVRSGNRCKNFRTDCDYKNALCRGEKWQRTNSAYCCQFGPNAVGTCNSALGAPVCGRSRGRLCRSFNSRCEMNKLNAKLPASARWTYLQRGSCKCIKRGQTQQCVLRPRCRLSRTSIHVCARSGQLKRLFKSKCDLMRHNYFKCENYKSIPLRECRLDKQTKCMD